MDRIFERHDSIISGCAVALRSILDDDFVFGSFDTGADDLDNLHDQASVHKSARPVEEATFTIIVRPAVPEKGLTLQVGRQGNE